MKKEKKARDEHSHFCSRAGMLLTRSWLYWIISENKNAKEARLICEATERRRRGQRRKGRKEEEEKDGRVST